MAVYNNSRTIRVLGNGFGEEPAELDVFLKDEIIFSGTVPTLNEPVPILPDISIIDKPVPLFEFLMPLSANELTPMTIHVKKSSVLFAQILTNHSMLYNKKYTPEKAIWLATVAIPMEEKIEIFLQNADTPFDDTEIAELLDPNVPYMPSVITSRKTQILRNHGAEPMAFTGENVFLPINVNEPRHNVYIDDVFQEPDKTYYSGAWWWIINSGSIFKYDLNIKSVIFFH
jgi:hypothetical protein